VNRLYYGDNLKVMERMPLSCVDLIYLDPPFKSDQNYNLVYKTMTGKPVPEQAQAFCDTWDMDAEKEKLAKSMPVLMREKGVADYYVEFWRLWVQALRHTQPHLMAYLIYMVQRLLYMKTILRPTGSLYLHCDSTASHYIKIMLDGIFGHQNFRNEIIWKRTTVHSDSKTWSRVSDTILFYTKSDTFTWNRPRKPHSKEYLTSKYNKDDGDGRVYMLDNMTSPHPRPNMMYEWKGFPFPTAGWRYSKETMAKLDEEGRVWYPRHKDGSFDTSRRPRLKRYLAASAGQIIDNVWTDISPVNSQARERLGYPTQKPLDLLKRLIEASSNKGDVVFDPFCGCGTTVYAAQETGRDWIGCDIAILAIKLIREILTERYRLLEGKHFDVSGIPASVEQAEELFKHDPFQFQHWAVERVGGFPTQQKAADKGIDGRLYFETKKDLKSMIISVKGGNIRPTDLRDLRGVLERESNGAELTGFISLHEATKAMRQEAATAGMYEYAGRSYPRMQLLTIKEIIEGKQEFMTPTKVGSRIASGQQVLAL
jgi:site-specific DNA-methyltransferase (adenine-specific)